MPDEAETTEPQSQATPEQSTTPPTSNESDEGTSKKPNDTEKAREITTREAYFASLNSWVKHANISQNAMALFPWYLLSSYPQIFQNQAGMAMGGLGPGIPAPPIAGTSFGFASNQQMPNMPGGVNIPANAGQQGFGGLRILDDNSQAEIINRTGGYEYVIAPFWKRAVAEMIDVAILLLLKVMVAFTVMNIFDLDLGFDLDKEVLRKAIDEEDYTGFLVVSMDLLAFSSDLVMLEVFTKIIVCFYEAIWTTMYNGATPGKALMNLRIQYVEAVVPLPMMPPQQPPQLVGFQAQRVPMRALIFPAETPSFRRAFMRASAKNLIMTLLFPMCFIMIFFKNNRTAYDIITKTIVVEDNPNRVLRAR